MPASKTALRHLPSVSALLATQTLQAAAQTIPRWALLAASRAVLDELRDGARPIVDSPADRARWCDALAVDIACDAKERARFSLKRVINATGVVLHTNLGRSVLSPRAIAHATEIATHYSNLELDLAKGTRGSRYSHVTALLCELTGAEDALVVNNNAAAVILCLSALAAEREVVLSRGEMVEIGGSFRIPEIMKLSGCRLVEVGTTNRTHLRDYEEVVRDETALLLKVHTSNFKVVGFTKAVSVAELKSIAAAKHLPVLHDLGAGCLVDLRAFGLPAEPTVREALSEGADLVTFSGDKLLGGPQIGVIAGRADLIAQLKSHQLLRALRVDKLTLAAFEATLRAYADNADPSTELPVLHMLSRSADELDAHAHSLMHGLQSELSVPMRVVRDSSRVGAGASPEATLETAVVAVRPARSLTRIEQELRCGEPAILARLCEGELWFDIRTLLPGDADALRERLVEVLGAS